MLHDSFMSRPNTIVVPGGKMELAMQLIFTPMILRLLDRRAQERRGALRHHERRHPMKLSQIAHAEHAADRRRWPMRCACSRSMRWSRRNPAIPACRMGMADIAEALWAGT